MDKHIGREERTCPKCGRNYKGHPAISRMDNLTPICPLCGTREALEAMGIEADEIEKIVGTVEANLEE